MPLQYTVSSCDGETDRSVSNQLKENIIKKQQKTEAITTKLFFAHIIGLIYAIYMYKFNRHWTIGLVQ